MKHIKHLTIFTLIAASKDKKAKGLEEELNIEYHDVNSE